MDYIKLKYNNGDTLGGIYYAAGNSSFFQILYLRADEITPITVLEEEGELDVKGNFEPTFQLLKYRYSVVVHAIQPVMESLAQLRLHDHVEIVWKNDVWGIMKDIDVSIEPEDFGCLSKVTIEFGIKDNDIIKSECYGSG